LKGVTEDEEGAVVLSRGGGEGGHQEGLARSTRFINSGPAQTGEKGLTAVLKSGEMIKPCGVPCADVSLRKKSPRKKGKSGLCRQGWEIQGFVPSLIGTGWGAYTLKQGHDVPRTTQHGKEGGRLWP